MTPSRALFSPLAVATSLSLALVCGAAAAQTKLKPGLWEHAITVASESGQVERAMAEAQAKIARLPPEQRREIEAMMAARGVALAAGGGSTTTLRICLTPANAERGNVPVQVGECSQNVVARDGDTTKISFVCMTEPPSSGNGELRILSPTANIATARVTTTVNGKPDRIDTTQKGTWVADDCGSVAPPEN